MEISQLMEIAHEVGVKVSPDDSLESVIYAILDKHAIDSAAESVANTKRKRTRIAKKEKDKVYTVSGKTEKTLIQSLQSARRNLLSTHSLLLPHNKLFPQKKMTTAKPLHHNL